MDPLEVLLVCLFTLAGFYYFIDYRKNPTRKSRGYLISTTMAAVVAISAPFLLTIPGLSGPQKESIRLLIASYFVIFALLWIGRAVTDLCLRYWGKDEG